MNIIEKTGVMASLTWNSNKWKDKPSSEDLKSSKYDYVRDEAQAHESINFAHISLPTESNGWFIGYSSSFNKGLPVSRENLKILFLISTDHSGDKRRYIVGIYGFPEFGKFDRHIKLPKKFKEYDGGNFQSKAEDIVLFDHYLPIDNTFVQVNKLLPVGKKISQRGWNYLNSDNVENILQYVLKHNPNCDGLKRLINKFNFTQEYDTVFPVIEKDWVVKSDSLKGIADLENSMKDAVPGTRALISSYIERGAIAKKVKKLTGYKCLICEALKMNPIGFLSKKDIPYIEAHHVIPVSKKEKGSLSIQNIITVCANHHRQFHYGKVACSSNTTSSFIFDFDGQTITINKITIPK